MFGYQMKDSFSCMIYHLSLYGYRMKQFSSSLMYYLSYLLLSLNK